MGCDYPTSYKTRMVRRTPVTVVTEPSPKYEEQRNDRDAHGEKRPVEHFKAIVALQEAQIAGLKKQIEKLKADAEALDNHVDYGGGDG